MPLLRSWLGSGLTYSVSWDTIHFSFSRFCFPMSAMSFFFFFKFTSIQGEFVALPSRNDQEKAVKSRSGKVSSTYLLLLKGLFGGHPLLNPRYHAVRNANHTGRLGAALGLTVPAGADQQTCRSALLVPACSQSFQLLHSQQQSFTKD